VRDDRLGRTSSEKRELIDELKAQTTCCRTAFSCHAGWTRVSLESRPNVCFRPIADIRAGCQLLVVKLAPLLATCVALAGCTKNTACYGVTDSELLHSIQRAYAKSRMTPEMAKNFRLDKRRVLAVERFGSKGEGALSGMLFRQDDGSLLSIRLFEDCTYQASPGKQASDLKNWAYPLASPRF
jgi:hypothetical protein